MLFFINVIYIKKYNVTLINISFIFKKMLLFKFIFKDLIELIKYFKYLKHFNIYYLFLYKLKLTLIKLFE